VSLDAAMERLPEDGDLLEIRDLLLRYRETISF